MLDIIDLSYSYPQSEVKAIDDVSFSFPSAGLFYIIGESGSGKSTFMKVLAGLNTDYQGKYIYKGKDINQLSVEKREDLLLNEISFCGQEDLFDPEETAFSSIKMGLEVYSLSRTEKLNRIKEYSHILSVESLLSKKNKELSGGELKRVSLVRSLVKDYSCLLLDEPLGPLDKLTRRKLISLFRDISKSKLVIIISHSVSEIEEKDSVLTFKDGKMSADRKARKEKSSYDYEPVRRKPFSAFSIFKRCISSLFCHRKRFFSSLSASSLAFVSLGLISLISSSISSGLKDYFSSEEGKNTMQIQYREKELKSGSPTPVSYQVCSDAMNDYPDYVQGIGAYYKLNFENLFQSGNRVFVKILDKEITFNSLSGRNFEEFTYSKELGDEDVFEDIVLDEHSVGLGLSPFDAQALIDFLSIKTNDNIRSLNEYIDNCGLTINLSLRNNVFHYYLKDSFTVERIISSSYSQIIHNSPSFGESFVEDGMRFVPSCDEKGPYVNPWTIYKNFFLFLKPKCKSDFLELISRDGRYSAYVIKSMKEEWEITGCESLFKNRVKIKNKAYSGISYSDIYQIGNRYKPYIEVIYLSDNFYYCNANISGSGFLRPIYVSSKRELLNKIADYNYEADFDLEGFQGASIQYEGKVVKGDLSQTSDNPLAFHPFIDELKISKGKKPSNYQEVAISSKLAEYLFQTASKSLNQTLFITCLKETIKKDGGYKNIFTDGEVKITGVVENDKDNLLYQKPRFLQALQLEQLGFEEENAYISHALITFKPGFDFSDVVENLESQYSQYKFSFPSKEMCESIDRIIFYIGNGLLIFGLFSGAIACCLICLVLILFINEGQKKNLVMKELGFTDRDIRDYYLGMNIFLTASSIIASIVFLVFFSRFFSLSLSNILGVEFSAYSPGMYISVVSAGVFLTFFSGMITIIKLKKKK